MEGVALEMNSLLIINGCIDEYIQVPYYPEFAVNNTYGIVAYNQSVYEFTQLALYGQYYGCMALLEACFIQDLSRIDGYGTCAEAGIMCRDTVESAYYMFADRGVYDIRHPYDDPTPPDLFSDYLNQAHIQEALGVDLNYSIDYTGVDIYYAFQATGDFVYPFFIKDLEEILNNGIRVSLIYGDADYIW